MLHFASRFSSLPY